MDKEEIGKKIDEVLQLEKWRSFVNGKVTGGLAVLEVLGIEKEKRIEVLAKALGLCTATATEYVNGFYLNLWKVLQGAGASSHGGGD